LKNLNKILKRKRRPPRKRGPKPTEKESTEKVTEPKVEEEISKGTDGASKKKLNLQENVDLKQKKLWKKL
jgi:hypothetical protein